MKVMKFDSFGEYEAWTDTFDNAADYQTIPAIIDDGWKVAADFFTECKSAKTAIRRFVRVFSEIFPDVKDWGEGMLESIESGYWNSDSHGYQDAEEERRIANTFGAFSWGVEETMEGVWYIYLNVSGEYAGRGQKAPAARYMEQVEQADSLDELDTITETAANDESISTAEYEEIHAAALRKAQSWDPQNRPQEDTATKSPYTAKAYQDNTGRLHLAVLDHAGECVYFRRGCTDAQAVDIVATLDRGKPWTAPDDGDPDPVAAYAAISKAAEARNGTAWEIATYKGRG